MNRPSINSEGAPISNPEAFWNWFGNSITVDENGIPKVFYHASYDEFDEFLHPWEREGQDDEMSEGYSGGNLGIGFYFTDDLKYAKRFGTPKKYYLKIVNPLNANDMADTINERFNDEDENWDYGTYGEVIDQICKEDGYDGVIGEAVGGLSYGASEIMVMHSTQIKSAENNSLFNPDTGKIFESFLNKMETLDTVLIEAVKSAYSVIFDNDNSPILAYHGTNDKFDKFDSDKTMDSLFWFSTNKDKIINGESGAVGVKYIMTCKLNIKNSAGWEEYDKYNIDQLISIGYDSVKLDDDYIVFNPDDIEIVKVEKVKKSINEAVMYRGLTQKYSDTERPNVEWFTPHKEYAEEYSSPDGEVIEQDVNVSNPIDLGFRDSETRVKMSDIIDRVQDRILDLLEENKISETDARNAIHEIDNISAIDGYKRIWEWQVELTDLVTILKKVGFDAYTMREGTKSQFITFGLFR